MIVVLKYSHEKFGSPVSWEKAQPYNKIPGPKGLPFVGIGHFFLPGGWFKFIIFCFILVYFHLNLVLGKYYGKNLPQLHKLINEEFGDIVMIPAMMGRRDMVSIYDPNDIEMVYRTEGQWPHRRGMDTFEYFRLKMRPDVFKGIGGLLTE